jgi:putative methyltransferase (TIGR04325 family)
MSTQCSEPVRHAGVHLMPDWASAVAEAGIGFEDALAAEANLNDREKFLSDRAKAVHARAGAMQLERHAFSLFVPVLQILGRSMTRQKLRVLDVGGSFGAYRNQLHDLCPELDLDWTVIETKATVEAFKSQETRSLRWRTVDQIREGSEPWDLGFICGTLPYLNDPHAEIQRYLGLCQHLILARVPVVRREEDQPYLQVVHFANHGQPVSRSYAGRFMSEAKLMAAALERGRMLSFFEDPPRTVLVADGIVPTYLTICLERRNR